MVCYCEIRKVLYIHIPKVGGLSVENILVNCYGFKRFSFPKKDYQFLFEPMGKIGIYKYILLYSNESKLYDLKSFYKFTFVRNPYSRSLSAIKYLHINSIQNRIAFPLNIDKFYEMSKCSTYYYMHFCLSQADCLKDETGTIDFDYIGRFENLINDLKFVLFSQLGLPKERFVDVHINSSDKSKLNLDKDKIFELVDEIHSEDFETFGFERRSEYSKRN